MDVFLTFDDGIQAGTEEVLAVLKETGVKATFFLVGIQLSYSYKRDCKSCLRLLKEIYENHAIGNHSYSHANNEFSEYYAKHGVIVDNNEKMRSILEDFEINKNLINKFIRLIDNREVPDIECLLSKNQKMQLARLPGRNSWHLSISANDAPLSKSSAFFSSCEKGTENISEQLFRNNYEVFGWNAEWNMSFEFYLEAVLLKREKKASGLFDYNKDEDTQPDFDMYSKENLSKDRLTETHSNCIEKLTKSAVDNKSVLLMHDRSFRSGFKERNYSDNLTENIYPINKSEADKLKSLIDHLKQQGVKFKSLDEYF